MSADSGTDTVLLDPETNSEQLLPLYISLGKGIR